MHSNRCSLEEVEHLDCFALFSAFFAGHFLDEAPSGVGGTNGRGPDRGLVR